MPLVTISVLKVWDAAQLKTISDHIHRALVEAFKIPESDYNHRILEFDPGHFIHSQYKTDKSVLIEMTVFPGRSVEAKKALYQNITHKLTGMGIPENDIMVVLQEPPLENWGLGGKTGVEVQLGFNLKV